MRILSLDRLVGPGRSIDENFEILCLELIKAEGGTASECYRNLPPDRGIDIFCKYKSGTVAAFQCKAYSKYSTGLVSALNKSIQSANKHFDKNPWDQYLLMIPFVPSASQRDKLNGALKNCKGKTGITDGDEIETRLFNYPDIASRFLPSVKFILPPGTDELILKTDDTSRLIRVHLESVRTGQQLPVVASADVNSSTLKNFLIHSLRLPDYAQVTQGELVLNTHHIHWYLLVIQEGESIELEPEMTLEEAQILQGATLRLMYKTKAAFKGGFRKPIGTPKATLGSYIFSKEEMNQNLLTGDRDFSNTLLPNYIDWHISRLLGLEQN